MKYLKKFNTEVDVLAWRMSYEHIVPNVVLAADSISYNVPVLLRVSIQHIDGNLYRPEEWTAKGFSNDEANGVAVVGDNASFVIAKRNVYKTSMWSSITNGLTEGVTTTTDSSLASTDYAGVANTTLILNGAASLCTNFTFPNGENGYLPALGELVEAYKYKSDIDDIMTLIGGTRLESIFWSSTQEDATYAWVHNWNNGSMYSKNKANAENVRPFTTLNP